MKNIYLIRHGESEGNVDGSVQLTKSDHALNLSKLGHTQAAAAGIALRSLLAGEEAEALRIWSSPYKRTRQTRDHIHFCSPYGDLRRRARRGSPIKAIRWCFPRTACRTRPATGTRTSATG